MNVFCESMGPEFGASSKSEKPLNVAVCNCSLSDDQGMGCQEDLGYSQISRLTGTVSGSVTIDATKLGGMQ